MEYIDFKAGRELEWLELNLLQTGRFMSKSKISTISGEEDEDVVDSWISELEKRSSAYRDPLYEVENNIIRPLKVYSDVPEYYLCVYYSFYGAADNSNGTKLFEILSAYALKNFIDGNVYVLGFPANKNLNSYLDELATRCLEERGLQASPDYKDDGVDAIGYKTFDDGRSGNFYVLMQCAAGIHWTKKKAINLGRWTNYIQWFNTNIICSISTVDYINQKDWSKRVSDYGMIFDRLRIYNFLYKSEIDVSLRADTLAWCEAKIGI